MATYVNARAKTFETSEAIAQNLRVKIASTGLIAKAGAADHDIGVAAREAFASGEFIAVNLATMQGTNVMVAGATIAPGDKVYGAAAGVVNKTATGVPVGIALSDATSGQDVEVLRRQFIDEV